MKSVILLKVKLLFILSLLILGVVNIYASAFATVDAKHQHILEFQKELDNIANGGGWFGAVGDPNTLPPRFDSTDYCMEDMCPGESFLHCLTVTHQDFFTDSDHAVVSSVVVLKKK